MFAHRYHLVSSLDDDEIMMRRLSMLLENIACDSVRRFLLRKKTYCDKLPLKVPEVLIFSSYNKHGGE